jgi:A/G-specific adenine glycosylase
LLIEWQIQYGRTDLPWQQQANPYAVWISEIMLQQTQVKTVIPYYYRFMTHFPDIPQLAQAEMDQVLALWTGLGYYARARNLHQSAQRIANLYGGHLPNDLAHLMALPGIGRSTAGAILSFGYHKPYPILDGNVKRVYTRFFGIFGWPGIPTVNQALWRLAEQYTPIEQTACYNQALMDLGAMICTPKNPKCDLCPLSGSCYAKGHDAIADLPERKPKKTLPQKTVIMLILQDDTTQDILLKQKPMHGLWGGLWTFPEYPTEHPPEQAALRVKHIHIKKQSIWPTFGHVFTHFKLEITPIHWIITHNTDNAATLDSQEGSWHTIDQALTRGLPAPTRRLVEQLKLQTP